MTTSQATPTVRPGLAGLVAFCALIDEPLAGYQKRIARAYFGPEREIAAILARGNAKTSLAALIGLHHLLTVPGASVTLGAASRDQARIAFERMRGFAQHPALDGLLTVRHLELRRPETEGLLRVVASDGPRAHGLSSTLYILDELWAHKTGELLEAMQTGLVKRPDAKLLVISTAAAALDSPLGRMRVRALAQPGVHRKGAVTEAAGELRWLEWSLGPDADLDHARIIKTANPAPWITSTDLARQRRAVPALAYAQFHACQWGIGEGAWLPPGAWAACRATVDPTPREVFLGIDIGGSRSASALVGVTPDLEVPICQVFQGKDAVLKITDAVLALQSDGWIIRELVYDPWRYHAEALRLEREHGVPAVELPQSHARMTVASEGLHAAVVEQRLYHPGHDAPDRHVAAAVARQTGRGWRLDKMTRDAQIDAAIALAMSVERAQAQPEAVQLLGWI